MTSGSKNKKKKQTTTRSPQGVPLTPEQIDKLVAMWNNWDGGIRAFAERIATKENPHSPKLNTHIESAVAYLRRVEKHKQRIAHWRFKNIADILEKTTEDLKRELSPTGGSNLNFYGPVPWTTDESVLRNYRTVMHQYHQTKHGDKIFWDHVVYDFSEYFDGRLQTSIVHTRVKSTIPYTAYGYLFREIFELIIKSDEKGDERDVIFLYPHFRRNILGSYGHFGMILNEDWSGQVGFGGCLLFHAPVRGGEAIGRQSPAVCKALNEHWKLLYGQGCNRLLHIFNHKPYSPPPELEKKLSKLVSVPVREKRSVRK
jgi:hypothetical protein